MTDYNNHTTKQIHELYQDIKEGRLVLQPDFQRRLVWNVAHKVEFIETILKGFPFPEIYIADRGINLTDITSERVVVDGQQRMDTIRSYIDGVLSADKNKHIPLFEELSSDDKTKFLAYQVNVCNIFGADEPTIKEIFRRINLTRYPLNSYEINNALYDGKFMSLGKEIAEAVVWDDYGVFNSRDIARMKDIGMVLNLMTLKEEGGYFAYDDLMEDYIQRYNDEYAGAEQMKERLMSTLKLIKDLDLSKKSIWSRKTNFYTMAAEFMLNYEKLPKLAKLKANLGKFEQLVDENKGQDNDYGTYYSFMYTGTNKRAERVGRGKLFRKHILEIKEQ